MLSGGMGGDQCHQMGLEKCYLNFYPWVIDRSQKNIKVPMIAIATIYTKKLHTINTN